MHALVLSREPRQEYDERFRLLSDEDVVVEAIARGSKKSTSKNSFHLEPGTHIDVEIVQGKEQQYIGSVVPSVDAIFFSSYFQNMQVLMYLSTLLSDVFEMHVPYVGLYKEVLDLRKKLQVGEVNTFRELGILVVVVLRCLGYEPVVDRCVRCGTHTLPFSFFRYDHGGVVCETCNDVREVVLVQPIALTSSELALLQEVSSSSSKNMQGNVHEEEKVHVLLHGFLEFHLERQVPKFVLMRV